LFKNPISESGKGSIKMSEKGDRARAAVDELVISFKDLFGDSFPPVIEALVPSLKAAIGQKEEADEATMPEEHLGKVGDTDGD
jgi:hypothetical protein